MTVSVADIDRWDAGDVREIFHACRDRADASAEAADGIATLPGLTDWGGDTALAAKASQHSLRRDLNSYGEQASAVADAASRAADAIEDVKRQLDDVRERAQDVGLRINPLTNRVFVGAAVDTADERRAAQDARPSIESALAALLVKAAQVDDALAAAIIAATGGAAPPEAPRPDAAPPPDDIALVDHETTHVPEPENNRRHNQIDAFEQLFGRPPRTPNDWGTAAALDPHSYHEENRGQPPTIVVGRISAVPGQGIVRANLFIPGDKARSYNIPSPLELQDDGTFDWTSMNAGDDRGFSSAAGPEESRVVIHTDFDNGIVIARQNPSVNLDTGEVATGTPSVQATQSGDGSVLISYAAADPLAPGGEGVAKATLWSVDGTLAVSPAETGPRVGGDVSSFPALEIYHDRAGAPSTTVLQSWPSFTTGIYGPLVGLPFDKQVGDHSLIADFNNYFPPLLRQPDLTATIGEPVVAPIAPELTVMPPMLTELRPVEDIPRIPVRTPLQLLPAVP